MGKIIDLKKNYKTRDGRKVRLLCDDAPGYYPVIGYTVDEKEGRHYVKSWTKEGKYSTSVMSTHDLDLVEAKREHVGWINVDKGSDGMVCISSNKCCGLFTNRSLADDYKTDKRIACVKIKFEEGEGL